MTKSFVSRIAWACAAFLAYAAPSYAEDMTPAKAAALIDKLGTVEKTTVDGPSSSEAHALQNHINGLGRLDSLWIVNYTDTGRTSGRILYWNQKGNRSYSVYPVGKLGGGDDYLGGMDSDGQVLAFTGRQPWVRFLRFPAGGSPIELKPFVNGTVTYTKVGLAKWPEPSPDTYVLMVSAGPPTSQAPEGNIELRVGSPTTDDWSKPVMLPSKFNDVWKNGEEESRPLVYMGNSVFAAFILKPGDDNYGFAYQVFSLEKNPTYRETDQAPYTVVPYLGVKFVEVSHPTGDSLRPSFRWAGAVTYKGGLLTLCASPRALNDAYSGNYYCWSAKAG